MDDEDGGAAVGAAQVLHSLEQQRTRNLVVYQCPRVDSLRNLQRICSPQLFTRGVPQVSR